VTIIEKINVITMCVTIATLIEVAMVIKPAVIRRAGGNLIMGYGMDFDWTHSSNFITACRTFLHYMLYIPWICKL